MNKLTLFALLFLTIPVILTAQLPAGFIAKYQLNNTATDISGNNYNGSLTSTAGTTNRFVTANSATAFTAGSSTGTLPLALVTAMQNDFSLGFWFKSTMTATSSTQWYGGKSLVDAEVCGGTSDWGTALIDGGKVCMGIGNPDITIKSTASSYNDGNWHFVTATRNKSTAAIILYMEGVQVATTTGTTTAALIAPNSIGLGTNPCVTTGVYTGSLDDIIVYNRVLSSTEVTNLYNYYQANAILLPLHWLSFTGELKDNKVELKWEVEAVVNNDHFEIEHSTDGVQFSLKGILHNADGLATASGQLYTFSDANSVKGINFYRIRQIDIDGRSSFSKTIQLKVSDVTSGIYLQSNPVADELVIVNFNQTGILRLLVIAVSGKIYIDRNIRSTDPVVRSDVHKLKPGYYLLKIIGANGNTTIPWIKL